MATSRREILFIAHRVPFPPDRGDKIRSYNELIHLAKLAPVHLAAFADDPRDLNHGEALSEITASHCVIQRKMSRPVAAVKGLLGREPLSVALFRDGALRAYIENVTATRPIGAIFVYSGQMAAYVRETPPKTRFVMDFCDVDSRKFVDYGRDGHGPMAWINRREGRLLGRYEVSIAQRADTSLFVSEAEAEIFRSLAGATDCRVDVIGNGVDLGHYDPSVEYPVPRALEGLTGPKIIFTGQMDYRPNVEGVVDFARTSMPAIRAVHPDAHFLIVGRKPSDAVSALASEPGVVVTGEVPDVRAYLTAADAVVAPLRVARGVQNKVLEAMAMARPVVASAQAAEGIDAVDRRDYLVAATPQDEAGLVNGILGDPARAKALGKAARLQVERRYSWAAALSPLEALVFGNG